jgi:hypothetical protein
MRKWSKVGKRDLVTIVWKKESWSLKKADKHKQDQKKRKGYLVICLPVESTDSWEGLWVGKQS